MHGMTGLLQFKGKMNAGVQLKRIKGNLNSYAYKFLGDNAFHENL